MLMHFKNCADDDECPVPDEVRESMLTFHNALLAHCGKSSSTVLSLQHEHLELTLRMAALNRSTVS